MFRALLRSFAAPWATVLIAALAVLGIVAVGSMGSTVYAQSSQSSCDALIGDEADIFKGNTLAIQAEAQKLINLGADVRVRTVQTFGSAGSLDHYEKSIIAKCASWRGSDGERKNNLIVLLISMAERKNGIYYGSQWTLALDSQWNRIRADFMNPRFQAGDFAGGFTAALKEISRVADLYLHPPVQQQSQQPVVVVVEQPAVQPVQSSAQSSGGSKVWLVFVVIFGVVGIGIGLFFLLRFLREARVTREKRRAAQQKARLAKQSSAERINVFSDSAGSPLQMFEIKVDILGSKASDADLKPLREKLVKIQGLLRTATESYTDLSSHSTTDPNTDGLSESEYGAMQEQYEEVLAKLREAEALLDDANQKSAELLTMIEAVPQKIQEAETRIAQTEGEAALQSKKGFKTDAFTSRLGEARARVTRANTSFSNKSFSEATQYASEATTIAEEVRTSAQNLDTRKAEIEKSIQAFSFRIEQVKGIITVRKTTFDEIAGTYAESSWESIRGNGTEATNRVNWALETVDDALDAASMPKQEWQEAEDIVQQANHWLDEAESFMRSIAALAVSLKAAKDDSSREIELAQTDIVKAEEYITSYDDDIREGLEDDLRTVQARLETARQELALEKPDYLKVVKIARDANSTADKILDEARDEHEKMERLRQKAVSSLRDARASVSKTKEYIEDHRYDAGHTADGDLSEAVKYLALAEGATDLATRISYAERADKEADSSYSQVSSIVAAAERRRREAEQARLRAEEERRQAAARAVAATRRRAEEAEEAEEARRRSSSSSHSWGSPSPLRHGGGGSGSWGSGSRGGGGSGSIGRSNKGGGGSGGW